MTSRYKIMGAALGLALAIGTLACGLSGSIPLLGPTSTPTATSTPTSTPTPTATPTPPPTPTPEPLARIHSGEQALFNGDWETALKEYSTARTASQDPQVQTAALLGLGRTYLLAGNDYEGVQALKELILLYPDAPQVADAHFFLAQAHEAKERWPEAGQEYLEYLTLRSGVIDGYVLELRGDALFAAGDYFGSAADYKASLNSPSLSDGLYIEMKLARAYAVSGDPAAALELYNDIYLRTTDDSTRALIDLRKGQAYLAMGDVQKANETFLDAVYNFPSAYESYSALLALVEAGAPVDELYRGMVDYYAGQYGVALEAFNRYLRASPVEPDVAYYFTGLSQRALGSYPAAITAWDQIIQNYPSSVYWDDAYEQKAYAQWAQMDQYTQAVETLLEFVTLAPSHPRAGEFLYDAALIAEIDNKLDQAAELWKRVALEYPGYEQAYRALFLSGISRYRLKDYNGALAAFQGALGMAVNLGDRAACQMWSGKAFKAMGDDATARVHWEQAASTDPTGYYSERARDLLRNRAPFTPPEVYDLSVDLAGDRRKAEAWLRANFGIPADKNLSGLGSLQSDPYLIRGSELWRLGLYSQARAEFEVLRQNISHDPEASYRLANYLRDLGLYRSATLTARQILDVAGLSDATTMGAPDYFNHLRFGTYFSEIVLPTAQEYDLHPLLVFSVIRQESMFESFVRSSAAANGLMQIIPSTGEEIARNLGWPEGYTTNDLYRPMINLRFGINYLAKQKSAFGGDLYAALAAYNGGPGNAREWLRLSEGDPDLFLEVIRFAETRTYIRAISEFFNIYRQLYDRTP